MADWLIVGGGIHGCTIAHALLRYTTVNLDAIRIVDPHEEPLAAWDRRVRQCGMRYLRSPAAHSIAPHFTDLLSWAREEGWDLTQHTIEPYARPSVDLFRAHAAARIAASGIGKAWVTGSAVTMAERRGGWSVALDNGRRIRAQRVVIATGRTGGARMPPWSLDGPSSRTIHVFDPGFSLERARLTRSPVVVGGGTSAVHLALTLAERPPRPVHSDQPAPVRIVSRRPLRIHQFDSDPCFIGPACMKRFLAIRDPDERRSLLDTARQPGSVPPDLARALESAVARGSVEWIEDAIVDARRVSGSTVELVGSGPKARRYESDMVILATGFTPSPPVECLLRAIRDASRTHALPVDSIGYPLPHASLQWAKRLYLSGPLAELELGPSAPNIIGAQNAAKRIISHLNGTPLVIPSAWRRYAPASVSSSSDSC